MKIPVFQVDAFADKLFSGNPAAVVFPESELTVETMQAMAAENNLAETAFVIADGEKYHIRWFTPTMEVDLCGHATLASAHVIFNHLGCSAPKITFLSKSGPLHVRKEGDVLYLNFPIDKPKPAELTLDIINGLRARPVELYRGRDDFLAVFNDEEAIASMAPDLIMIAGLPSRGIIVTAPGKTHDFVSRYFAPQSGIPEDPVTGSAHTILVPYWSKRSGKIKFHARQISRRGGELLCKDLNERVEIGGRAVTYLVGEISF